MLRMRSWLLLALASLGAPATAQAPGERFPLTPQARLFVPAYLARSGEPLDLVVHLHGDHALAQDAFFATWKRAALLSVHISGFSSVYTNYFATPQALQNLLDRAEQALQTRRPLAGAALTGDLGLCAFSAGYAGVREILKQSAHRPRVRAIVLGDGLHTGYVNGNLVDPAQMVEYLAFARSAVALGADFRFSHSAIVPGTYASTTECASYLIAGIGAARTPWTGSNELGMARTSWCERGRFAIHGFAGNLAADHVLHFRYIWRMLVDTAIGGGAKLDKLHDRFAPGGPDQRAWQHKFTAPRIVSVQPPAPGGDGSALHVQDPAGGYDSARLGPFWLADYAIEAQLWCDYRPQLAAQGFERVGVFARDDGNGGFEGSTSGGGSCYALTWDSHDGRIRCLKVVRGAITELLTTPVTRPSTGWRTLRIEAVGSVLSFVVDGVQVLATTDATFAAGPAGIGHHEFFADNRLALGAKAESALIEPR
jgi:hypothetical protein